MIGETKLGYKIIELVGQGGFGTVYKAVKKNKAMETVRALKHISLPSRKQWTDIYNSMGNDVARTDAYFDTVLQEILNEIRILADLTNKGVKNVVWYYENEIEDTPSPKHYDIYLLMEYLTSLPAYIESHEIKVKDVVKIGTDILSALIECHKNKIIHRDIKTDNIFVAEDGAFKLGDFGVSKKLSDKSRATSMKGTPNYIAPEVYLGQPYDETVDLYSLGIVLYRLLNYNRNPFMPNYPESYDSEDEDKAFELRMKGDTPSYPAFANGELGDVILKSISNKDNRYKNASEFKDALEIVLKNMSEEELEKVVLENMLSGVDLSTFGSKNERTQMASEDISGVADNSSVSKQEKQSGTYSNLPKDSNGSNNSLPKSKNKIKMVISIIAIAVVLIGLGAFFVMKSTGNTSEGKFVQVNGYDKFKKKNGEFAKNEWVIYDGNEYYFDAKESLVKSNSVSNGDKTYFVDENGVKIINDWHKGNDGKEYYLDSNGEPFTDTAKTINNEVFFFNKKGEKVTNGWFLYENDYYYLDNEGKMLKERFVDSSSIERYYLGPDGKMLKSTFYDIGNGRYYFDNDGKMKINTLLQAGDGVYFAQSDGTIKKNGWCGDNQYYAGEDGKILINTTTPDGVKVDGNGKRVQANGGNASNTNISSKAANTGGSLQGSFGNVGGVGDISSAGSSINNGSVHWGDHFNYTETVYLDEYGEDGGMGKITIYINKVKEDGSDLVRDINATLELIYNDARNRAEVELPYKYFELNKTSVSTADDKQIIILVTGEIKYTDNNTEKMRYKLMADREHGSVVYEKVR